MFHHLLVPLDGSPLAEAVLPAASFLAQESGARVTLLHIIERGAAAAVHGARHLTEAEEAESYLKEAAGRAFPPGVDVAWHVHARETPDVAHGVAAHTEEWAPELVIMCAHGEGRLRDWLSGNIPQQVVNRGLVPVLFLKPDLPATIRFPFRTILAPMDGKPEHEQGLPAAQALARICGASLRLLTVVATVHSLSGPQAVTGGFLPETTRAVLDLAEQQAAQYLAGHVEQLRSLDLRVAASVVRGDPAEQIAAAAREAEADLIVLGTHGKAGTEAFWSGSLAQRLIRRIQAWFLLAPAL